LPIIRRLPESGEVTLGLCFRDENNVPNPRVAIEWDNSHV